MDALSEGSPEGLSRQQVAALVEQLQEEAQAVAALALAARKARDGRYRLPRMANLSLVLCDDAYIRGMNMVSGRPARAPWDTVRHAGARLPPAPLRCRAPRQAGRAVPPAPPRPPAACSNIGARTPPRTCCPLRCRTTRTPTSACPSSCWGMW